MSLCFTWNPPRRHRREAAAARYTSRRTGSCTRGTSTRSGIDLLLFSSASWECQKHKRRGRSNTRHSRGRHRRERSRAAPYQILCPQKVPEPAREYGAGESPSRLRILDTISMIRLVVELDPRRLAALQDVLRRRRCSTNLDYRSTTLCVRRSCKP